MVGKGLTRGQIWEIVIVVTIILICIYRLALAYDFVPDAYQPTTILQNIYEGIKKPIKEEAEQDTFFGHIAKWTLDRMEATEKYFNDQQLRYIRAQEAADRCHENLIFRFFMFFGDEDNPNCSESNMQLKEATKQVFQDANTGRAQPGQANAPGSSPSAAAQAPTGSLAAPVPQTPVSAPVIITPPPAQAPEPTPVVTPTPVTPVAPPAASPYGGRQPVSTSEPGA